jgi:hypothetical protein
VSRRILIVGVVLMLAAPLAAQQSATVPQESRYQVQLFEAVLQRAVVQGGQKLAAEVSGASPNVMSNVMSAGDPVARGIPIPQGVIFEVQVPTLLQTFVLLNTRTRPIPPANAGQPTGPTRVTANGIATPDPMTPARVPGSGVMTQANMIESYSKHVLDSLVDAMLDNSAALSLKDEEYLVVAASAPPDPVSSLNNQDETTILSVKGADLAAFRQGKITKEEARKRVVTRQF